eukprot:7382115-Prymnesium_polylepis.1
MSSSLTNLGTPQWLPACCSNRHEGTRQAAHLFAVSNAEQMQKLGFKRCNAEPNIFTTVRLTTAQAPSSRWASMSII